MIEDAVIQLRARFSGAGAAPTAQESCETRLTLACSRGQGHVLVTGADRSAIDALLARVIEKVEPMAAVRARATDPAGGLDPVLSLVASESIPRAHLERRRALADLLARAETADTAVLVVVEDAASASVDQLERLRETLEWIPEALTYLRMVLVGDATLAAKLNTHEGRALNSRIASHICFDEGTEPSTDAPAPSAQQIEDAPRSYALTLAVATCVAFSGSVYLSAFLSGEGEGLGRRGEPVTVNVDSKDFAIAVGAPTSDPSFSAPSSSSAAPFTPAFSIPAPRPAQSVTSPALSTKSASASKQPAATAKAAPSAKPATLAPAGKPPAPKGKPAAATAAPGTKSATSKPAAKTTKSSTTKKAAPGRSSITTLMQRFD